ncbi:MAG TPA: methyltransferase domain-containing protein [Catenuloplanes sp.]|jgi:SAM-dependent methyltransferase
MSTEQPSSGPDADAFARGLAADARSGGDPTGWFETLYRAAESGAGVVPWDRGAPNPFLVDWTPPVPSVDAGRRALVVGCGLGDDAEYVAGLGFTTVAFDVAGSAVRACRRRYPDSAVRYRTADLFEPPVEWAAAFDLVVESQTVQALPRSVRATATARVSAFVAAGGTLLVLAGALGPDADRDDGPPWRLDRPEIEAFATGGLTAVRIEDLADPARPAVRRWRAEFRRD